MIRRGGKKWNVGDIFYMFLGRSLKSREFEVIKIIEWPECEKYHGELWCIGIRGGKYVFTSSRKDFKLKRT